MKVTNYIPVVLFIILAAICKSLADTMAHHSSISIFKNSTFWIVDSGIILPFTKYKLNGWHLCNSAMIVFFICCAAFPPPKTKWWIVLITGGLLFNIVFNVFYNHILLI